MVGISIFRKRFKNRFEKEFKVRVKVRAYLDALRRFGWLAVVDGQVARRMHAERMMFMEFWGSTRALWMVTGEVSRA